MEGLDELPLRFFECGTEFERWYVHRDPGCPRFLIQKMTLARILLTYLESAEWQFILR